MSRNYQNHPNLYPEVAALDPSVHFLSNKMDNLVGVSICIDNDAFGHTYESQAHELARIYRELANRLEASPAAILDPYDTNVPNFGIRDLNGNLVGQLYVSGNLVFTNEIE